MAFIDKFGVEYSDDRKVLVKCPDNITGDYHTLDSTLKISDMAFHNTLLKNIVLNKNLINISKDSFHGCKELEQIIIPDSVVIIDNKAFYDCKKLSTITLGKSLKYIGEEVFSGTKLSKIYWNIEDYIGFYKNKVFFNNISEFHIGENVIECPQEILKNINYLNILTIGKKFKAFVPKIDFSLDFARKTDSFFDEGNNPYEITIKQLNYNSSINIDWGLIEPQITSINLGSEVKILPSIRYGNTYKIEDKDFYIPEGIEEVCDLAFWGEYINKIYIPKTLKKFSNFNFVKNSSNLSFEIDKENRNFKYIDGILYLKTDDEYQIIALDSTIKKEVNIIEGVKHINVLNNGYCIEKITIPESVTSVSNYAFANCRNLKTVIWNAIKCNHFTNYCHAFSYVSNFDDPIRSTGRHIHYNNRIAQCVSIIESAYLPIQEIIFGDDVVIVPDNICNKLNNLKRVVIGKSIKEIPSHSFGECNNISEIEFNSININIKNNFNSTKWWKNLPEGLIYIGNCLYGCKGILDSKIIKIKPTCTYIAPYAFAFQKNIETIEIPEHIDTIEEHTFDGCTNLNKVIARGICTIKNEAFYRCENLVDIKLGNLSYIENKSFADCYNLKHINLQNVVNLGYDTFKNCYNLEPIYSNEFADKFGTATFADVKKINSIKITRAEDATIIKRNNIYELNSSNNENYNIKEIIWDVENYILDKKITYGVEIYSPIYRFKALERICFTDKVKEIPSYFLDKCNTIKEVILSKSLTSIKNYAFSGLELDELNIPNTVQNIEDYAFSGLKLKKLIWNAIDCKGGKKSFEDLNEIIIGDNVLSFPNCILKESCKILHIGRNLKIDDGNFSKLNNLEIIYYNIKECYKNPFYLEVKEFLSNKVKIQDSLSNISKFIIGKNVEKLNPRLFTTLNRNANILIEENKNFITEGDVIYNHTKTEIIYIYPTISGNVIIPNTVTSLPPNAFAYTNIESLIFPDSLYEVPQDCCLSCNLLQNVTLGQNVKKIDSNAFKYCKKLKFINLPESIIELGDYIFYDTDIQNINLPNSIEIIGRGIISAKNIFQINIPENLRKISAYAFGHSPIKTVIWNAIECLEVYDFYYNGFEFYSLKEKNNNRNLFNEGLLCFIIGNKVKSIPTCICKNISSLTYLEIPSNVNNIEYEAFAYCKNLEQININNNYSDEDLISIFKGTPWLNKYLMSYKYDGNIEVEYLKLPEDVRNLNKESINQCINIKELEIPRACKRIDYESFNFCTELERIIWNAEYATIRRWYNETHNLNKLRYIKFTNSVVSIPNFYNLLQYVKTIEIGENVSEINESFNECRELYNFIIHPNNKHFSCDNGILYNKEKTKLIRVPQKIEGTIYLLNTVTEISDLALEGCEYIDDIIIPEECKIIGHSAFKGCKKLSKLHIPMSLQSIAINAFDGCDNLKELYWDSNNCEITYKYEPLNYNSEINLANIVFSDNVESIPAYFSKMFPDAGNIIIGQNVKYYGDYAFSNYKNLKVINFKNVQYIGLKAFSGCEKLTDITISKSLLEIKDEAFMNCNRLTHVNWESDIVKLPKGIFSKCANLKSIKFNKNIREFYDYAFNDCCNLTNIELSDIVFLGKGFNTKKSNWKDNIPTNLEIIYSLDFLDPTIKTIHIGYKVSLINIKWDIFEELEYIIVDPNNKQYFSLDGVLYNKETYEIIHVPAKIKGYIRISDGTKTLSKFKNKSLLEGLILPDSLIEIEESALENCTSLNYIEIPKNVNKIKTEAFLECHNLSCILIKSSNIVIEPFVFNPSHKASRRKYNYFEDYYTEETCNVGFGHIYQEGTCIDENIVSINDQESYKLEGEAEAYEASLRDEIESGLRTAFESDPEAYGGIWD